MKIQVLKKGNAKAKHSQESHASLLGMRRGP